MTFLLKIFQVNYLRFEYPSSRYFKLQQNMIHNQFSQEMSYNLEYLKQEFDQEFSDPNETLINSDEERGDTLNNEYEIKNQVKQQPGTNLLVKGELQKGIKGNQYSLKPNKPQQIDKKRTSKPSVRGRGRGRPKNSEKYIEYTNLSASIVKEGLKFENVIDLKNENPQFSELMSRYNQDSNKLAQAKNNLNSLGNNLKAKLQTLNYRIEQVQERGRTVIPLKIKSIMSKIQQDFNQENYLIDEFQKFMSQEQDKLNQITTKINQYALFLSDIIKETYSEMIFSTQLEVNCSIMTAYGLENYESINFINNDILAAKIQGQTLIDFLKVSIDGEVFQKIFTVDDYPTCLTLDEGRIIIDNLVFSQNSDLLQTLSEKIQCCLNIDQGKLLVGLDTCGKLQLLSWSGSEYIEQEYTNTFTTSHYQWRKLQKLMKENKDQSQTIEILAETQGRGVSLYKLSFNPSDLKSIQKLKLSGKFVSYMQVNDDYIIVLNGISAELIDLNTGILIQAVNLGSSVDFVGVPIDFHGENFPVGLVFNKQLNKVEVIDFLKKGYQGSSNKIDQQFQPIKNIKMKTQRLNYEKQIQVLVQSSTNQSFKLLNITVDI